MSEMMVDRHHAVLGTNGDLKIIKMEISFSIIFFPSEQTTKTKSASCTSFRHCSLIINYF